MADASGDLARVKSDLEGRGSRQTTGQISRDINSQLTHNKHSHLSHSKLKPLNLQTLTTHYGQMTKAQKKQILQTSLQRWKIPPSVTEKSPNYLMLLKMYRLRAWKETMILKDSTITTCFCKQLPRKCKFFQKETICHICLHKEASKKLKRLTNF